MSSPLDFLSTPFVPPKHILEAYPLETLGGLKYNNSRYIATGGTSEIYVCTLKRPHMEKSEYVAVKVLRGAHCDTGPGVLEPYCRRLKREAEHLTKVARDMHHDNIVPFYGISPWNLIDNAPTPGLVSAFYRKQTVTKYLAKDSEGKTIKTPQICLNLIRGTADGLTYLHSMGMIHGDLKPNNVLVKDDGSAALCDFGQARLMDFPTNLTTELRSTPHYTAPELLPTGNGPEGISVDSLVHNVLENKEPAGRSTTFKSDVYAFAMTILEISSGVLPYPQQHRETVIVAIVKGKKPSRERHAATSDIKGLWEVIENCWVNGPLDRPEMTQVVEKLKDLTV